MLGAVIVLILVGGVYFDHHIASAPAIPETTTTEESTSNPATGSTKPGSSQGESVEVESTQTISITGDDNGKTITVKKGSVIVVAISMEKWTLTFTPNNILTEIKNVGVIEGMQGVFSANKAGKTVLTAEGRPNCKEGQMCAQYIKNFTTTIVVK